MRFIFINKSNQLRAGWEVLLAVAAMFVLKRICMLGLSLWTDSEDGWVGLFNGLGLYILFVVGFVVKVIRNKPLASIGLVRPDGKRLLTGFLSGASLLIAVIAIMLLLDIAKLQGDGMHPHWGRIDPVDLYVVSILAGISEEVLCRGYIQQLLSSRLSPFWAMIIISAGFSLGHMINGGFTWISALNIALVSLVFSGVTFLTGNLYFAVAFHTAWNLFQGYVFGVPVSGHPVEGIYSMELQGANWLSGGSFGLEGSAITTLALGLVCAAMWIASRKKTSCRKETVDDSRHHSPLR
ncbi:CPBP family intramembrane metalloprotease [Paenibacillus sp. alder61]|uniref:CPBP family intramembrane glutamic endopeptidase n=1 Tax=Paenibacillus sp. alder61 TaxID=2862948 RepID=UPI001CD5378D|nr:CPBP family intramembrane glutamic endopeptidase [Paenibacillus sp. alder61]MCA1291494.1 CPBP family intramembrane metalloprotease [Paenibacillus sp. alder61]